MRTREKSEVEFWKGKVRELEAEVRRLKKESGRMEKKARQLEVMVDEHQDDEIEAQFEMRTPSKRCPECGGGIEAIEFKIRTMLKCIGAEKPPCGWFTWTTNPS